jgi:hypothetical protein
MPTGIDIEDIMPEKDKKKNGLKAALIPTPLYH